MGSSEEPTYFTCTLGQAAAYPRGLDQNINDFIDRQAQTNPSLPAVGFYSPSKDPKENWKSTVFTFQEVHSGSCSTAKAIAKVSNVPERETVALLCPSSADFLLAWLALMRLGHPVLLIAPQCSPSAIAHLCKQCGTSCLFYDDVYESLAKDASKEATNLDSRLSPLLLPFVEGSNAFEVLKQQPVGNIELVQIPDTEVAYLHHTSGTSTGIPKPIPQSHRAGCGVLPRLNGKNKATFTTTPLYHGGVADLFRAWTSNAMIWLFPGKEVPITASNVVKCLESSKLADAPSIRYFSSVPYVLEMMASNERGLSSLRDMDIVGVGGAALPTQVGDRLVAEGVNLVSRFGSAECGFLMSSHRDYTKDSEWQYLRPGDGSKFLRFEKRDEGLCELVILSGWPHIAKTNREDGSFATSDLLAAHPTIPNAWRYAARADSQLTLVTGKKFDPSPLESAISASSALIQDVLVFGNGMPYPGALLFRSEAGKSLSDQEVVKELSAPVEDLNRDSQSHARIPRNMLVPMSYIESPLDKSSKGTILRGKAEERYAAQIENAYDNVFTTSEDIPDVEVEGTILNTVSSIMEPSSHGHEKLQPETDLFAYGVDSVASVQIRHAAARLLPKGKEDLPMTVVQDAGTVQKLSQLIVDIRHGNQQADRSAHTDPAYMMEELAAQYSSMSAQSAHQSLSRSSKASTDDGKVILLTGPTGAIGSHLLRQLLDVSSVKHIHLLLRGATQEAARERVIKALETRKLGVPTEFGSKVSIHTCKLADTRLGLPDETYNRLAQEVDIIYHLAWSVDFLLPLHGFRQHFAGLQSLLQLSTERSGRNTCKFIFCSSTASVASFSSIYSGQAIPEQLITDPKVSGGIGYSQSKWVAENICLRAAGPHSDVTIVRVGQVSGDTINGVWNQSEAYPLMLASATVTGSLPGLPNEKVDWIPVDRAARAFVELLGQESAGVRALHVLNEDRSTSWRKFLNWIREDGDFKIVEVDEWLRRLERLRESGDRQEREHPALKLLDFWKKAYGGGGEKDAKAAPKTTSEPGYEMSASRKAMPVLSSVGPMEKQYAIKLWRWSKASIGGAVDKAAR